MPWLTLLWETVRTLWRVDQSIVEAYYARALQGDLPSSSSQGTEDALPRLLEILDVICGDNAEAYAQQVKFVLKAVEGEGPLNRRIVVQEAVEEILNRIHTGKQYFGTILDDFTLIYCLCLLADSTWRRECIGVLFTSMIDSDGEVGPTLIVILTALLCEYLDLSPISPPDLSRGLPERLSSSTSQYLATSFPIGLD